MLNVPHVGKEPTKILGIGRELRRAPLKSNGYDASLAHLQSQVRRLMQRRIATLHTDGHLPDTSRSERVFFTNLSDDGGKLEL
jgi:hypothetical protein